MADLKTKPTENSVLAFLEALPDSQRKQDALSLLDLMQEATGEIPRMWGDSMIGFGSYHYKYASGHEGDTFLVGFSPRKDKFSLYIMAGFDQYGDLLAKLGKVKTGKACLYVKKLADVDLDTLRELIRQSVAYLQQHYPAS